MWNPTHIQVIVLRAKGLLTKGKNGTNNCFATIEVGKEKYATSIKESAPPVLEWHEECELTIPDKGNRAELVVKCLHRNNFSVDEFLGQVTLPLSDMDVYEKPRSKWYKLQSKPGKDKKDKDRGELEIRIAFTVKSGSLMDLSKKEKKGSTLGSSLGLGGGGGSLLSINTLEKKKKLKDFAKSLGSKVHLTGKPKKDKQNADNGSNSGSISSIDTPGSGVFAPRRFGQSAGDADPGVISEDEDEFVFDKLSHKSSGSSLNVAKVPSNSHQTPPSPLASNSSKSENEDIRLRSKTLPPSKPPRINGDSGTQKVDEWEAKLYGKHLEVGSSDSLKRRSWESSRVMLSSQQDIHESTKEPAGEHALANTAPTTPNLEDQKRTTSEQVDKPRPLPRSATLESIVEKEKETKEEVVEKKPEKRLSKFKYFRKEKTDSLEDIKHKLGNKQFGERIIIGHENDLKRHGAEVPQELLKKYDGKSREEIILFANDLENEVRIQKMKMKEMEDYLDNLLLRVMETQPKLLQNPYRSHNSTKSG